MPSATWGIGGHANDRNLSTLARGASIAEETAAGWERL